MQQAHLQHCVADVLQCLLYSLVVGQAALQGHLPPRQVAQSLRRLSHMQLGRAAWAGGDGSSPTCSSTDLSVGCTLMQSRSCLWMSWRVLQGRQGLCGGSQPLQPGTNTMATSLLSASAAAYFSRAGQTAHQLTAPQRTTMRPPLLPHPAAALSR